MPGQGSANQPLSLRPIPRSHSAWQDLGTRQMWVLIPDPLLHHVHPAMRRARVSEVQSPARKWYCGVHNPGLSSGTLGQAEEVWAGPRTASSPLWPQDCPSLGGAVGGDPTATAAPDSRPGEPVLGQHEVTQTAAICWPSACPGTSATHCAPHPGQRRAGVHRPCGLCGWGGAGPGRKNTPAGREAPT